MMPFQLLNPWGLLALGSMGGILFLYFYVFHGRRRRVSALFLWEPDRSLREEGQKRDRPPITLPLILELLAALLLSLLVAGLAYRATQRRPEVVVLLDASASMNASTGEVDFTDRAAGIIEDLGAEMGRSVRFTLVESFKGRVLVRDAAIEKAVDTVQNWKPAAPPHGFQQSVEIARSLHSEDDEVVFISDHTRTVPGVRNVSVGQSLANTAWTSGRWTGRDEIFARLTHFGAGEGQKRVVMKDANGRVLAKRDVDLSKRKTVPLTLKVPGGVESVVLSLPEDALQNDNQLRLIRPSRVLVPVRMDLENEALTQYLKRALLATGKVKVTDDGEVALLCTEGTASPSQQALLTLQFHSVPLDEATTVTGPYFVVGYAPLTRGANMEGVIWSADGSFEAKGADTLVSAGDIPLVVKKSNVITMNLVSDGTNLFRQAAWPVLVSNMVDAAHRRMPGVQRFSYRTGENLRFERPLNWKSTTVVEAPDGRTVEFEESEIYYGTLEQNGVYRVYEENNPDGAVKLSVNLLAEQESDLSEARSHSPAEILAGGSREREEERVLGPILGFLATLCLFGGWYCLERRTKAVEGP